MMNGRHPLNSNRNRSRFVQGHALAPYRPRRYDFTGFKIAGIIAVGLFVVILGVVGCRSIYQGTEGTVNTVIIDKERVCDGDGNGGVTCQYLVFTEAGTYKLVDSTGLLSGKTRFNSSDVYGRIKVGEPATIRYIGWRIGFASEYPNILDITQE